MHVYFCKCRNIGRAYIILLLSVYLMAVQNKFVRLQLHSRRSSTEDYKLVLGMQLYIFESSWRALELAAHCNLWLFTIRIFPMLRNFKLGGLLKLTDWKQIERVKIFQILGRKTFSFVSKLSKELPALKASGEKIGSRKFFHAFPHIY